MASLLLLQGVPFSGFSAVGGVLRLSVIPTAPSRRPGRCGSFALRGLGRAKPQAWPLVSLLRESVAGLPAIVGSLRDVVVAGELNFCLRRS